MRRWVKEGWGMGGGTGWIVIEVSLRKEMFGLFR